LKNATLHQLKVFEVAARHSSFTRAAEELFLTQPTVSMQIKQLTKIVGLPLFEQVGKKLYLTNAGKSLFTTCQEVFARLSQFEMTIADMKGLKQGSLALAVVTTAKYVVPRLLGPFCQSYPGIDVTLKVANHDRLIERLSDNNDDLYILSQLPQHMDISVYPFLENPLVVIASRDHHLAKERDIPLERMANEPFIMRETGSGTRRAVHGLFDERKISLKIKLELASNEAIKQAVAGGLGISVLSRHTLALEGAMGKLTILDVQEFPIKSHWYVIHLAGRQLSVVARTFLEYLQTDGKEIANKAIES
jgi:LysR family transcriptional regulator, low CO2-responsive transcriptional regulator